MAANGSDSDVAGASHANTVKRRLPQQVHQAMKAIDFLHQCREMYVSPPRFEQTDDLEGDKG